MDPAAYDRALAELALPGTVDEAGQATADPAPKDGADSADTASTSPFTDGVRLYVPGAHVVSTRQLGQVTEAIAHTLAARGIVCVYGDPGHGKTVAVHQALRLLPRRAPVHRALVAVKLMACRGVSVGHRHLSVSGVGLMTWWLVLMEDACLVLTVIVWGGVSGLCGRPSRPTMTGYGKPAEKTPEVEDFRVTVPCLAVQDRHKDLAWQVVNSPTYTVRRMASYSLIKHMHNQTSQPQTSTREMTYGISKTATDSYRVSTGVTIGFEMGVGFFGIGGTISGSVTTEVGYERSTSVTEMREEKHIEALVTAPGTAAALYCAHHKLQVIREDNSLAGDQPGIDFDIRNSYLTLQYPPAKEGSADLAAQDGKGELAVAVGGGIITSAPTPYEVEVDGTPA